jgi:hypothetical protein
MILGDPSKDPVRWKLSRFICNAKDYSESATESALLNAIKSDYIHVEVTDPLIFYAIAHLYFFESVLKLFN